MRISWKWLAEFVDPSVLPGCKDPQVDGPRVLSEILTSRGLEVEGIERLDHGFEKVVVAQILEKKPHPQADRLSLCQVTIGQGEPLAIVCGAQNMKAGDKVALAQVGSSLPNGMKISQGKIRGEISNGMLCSESELRLAEESEGILILPENAPLGMPLAKVLGRDDIILSLKLTANRGDCLSHIGIAREVAAAVGTKVKFPQFPKIQEKGPQSLPYEIELNAGPMNPQFYGCLIRGVKVGPSPEWLVKRLESLGSRSINNVVDVSNLVMLEMGHPTHAYDASRIEGGVVRVRQAAPGETLPLLDGTEITLQGFEVVIADGKKPIGLAGVMGGGNSEVQNETKDIFFECAEFDPTLVRKASSKHQKKTDASHRFERGIDPAGLSTVVSRAVSLILELAGGKVEGSHWEHLPSRSSDVPEWKRQISFKSDYLRNFLGFDSGSPDFAPNRVKEVLEALGCKVISMPGNAPQGEWIIEPPSYRLDLAIREDIAEEVARCVGYAAIPATLPQLTSSPVFTYSSSNDFAVIEKAKDCLKGLGFHETLNYAFTSSAWLGQLGMRSSVELLNPLSEEYRSMVPSLLPGLIRNASENWNRHFGSEQPAIRLFELRPVFSAAGPIQSQEQTQTGVQESWKLSWILSGPRYAEGLRSERGEVDFFDVKATVEGVLTALGTKGIRFQSFTEIVSKENPLFHPGKSAIVLAGNRIAGVIGLLHPGKAQELKSRAPLWMVELDWQALIQLSRKSFDVPAFRSWPVFPPMERDYALVVSQDVSAEKLCQVALKAGKPLAKTARVFDVYKGIAVRVIFYDEGRSLQESETEAVSARILESWKKELGADLRS
ncbi:MAG: phenylalanine--tRNA ligase subunit beta [Bdellovibrio sp.]|nr:phenylalanine--tRNA ligase subunit beta [Bdellovibrio sp.]